MIDNENPPEEIRIYYSYFQPRSNLTKDFPQRTPRLLPYPIPRCRRHLLPPHRLPHRLPHHLPHRLPHLLPLCHLPGRVIHRSCFIRRPIRRPIHGRSRRPEE
jgi:hypothetical protein